MFLRKRVRDRYPDSKECIWKLLTNFIFFFLYGAGENGKIAEINLTIYKMS